MQFASEGAEVVINYRSSQKEADELCEVIRDNGGVAHPIAADVSNLTDVSQLFAKACEQMGGIDILANVAGADILTGTASEQSDQEKLQALMNTDLQGTILCCWTAVEYLQQGRQPAVINMSWDLALRGMAGRNPEMFAAVKAGITGFTRSFAQSVAPTIRVNEVAPGWIETEFAATTMTDAYRADVIDATPLRRFGKPLDVANAVLFLASDESNFVTGQTVKVNGGLSS